MASESRETVADIVRIMRNNKTPREQMLDEECTTNTEKIVRQFLVNFADRIEAAHRREIAFEIRHHSDLLAMAIDRKDAAIADLRRRLRVAADALALCIGGMCGECHRQNHEVAKGEGEAAR